MLQLGMEGVGTARAQSGYAIRFKRTGLSERRDKARVASYLVCALRLWGKIAIALIDRRRRGIKCNAG